MDNELKSRRLFAARLRWMLSDKGLSQTQLARLADISEATISRYCHGTTSISMHNVQRIANVLGCSVEDLIK